MDLLKNSEIKEAVQELLLSHPSPSAQPPDELSRSGSSIELTTIQYVRDKIEQRRQEWEQEFEAASKSKCLDVNGLKGLYDSAFPDAKLKEASEQLAGKSGDVEIPLQLYLSFGYEFRMIGIFSDICALKNLQPQTLRSNMGFVCFVDPDAPLHEPIYLGGTGLIATLGRDHEGREHRCLLFVPSIRLRFSYNKQAQKAFLNPS